MKYFNSFSNIVIVGNWNHSIFTKEWLTRYAEFPNKSIKEEISIDSNASNRVSNKSISVHSIFNRLEFGILEVNESNLELLQEISIKISKTLIHTPVSRFGINFKFVIDDESEKASLTKYFLVKDSTKLEENNIFENSFLLSRNFTTEQDYDLNLKLTEEDGNTYIDFNFDFSIDNLLEFADLINKYKNSDLEEYTKDLIKKIYGVSCE